MADALRAGMGWAVFAVLDKVWSHVGGKLGAVCVPGEMCEIMLVQLAEVGRPTLMGLSIPWVWIHGCMKVGCQQHQHHLCPTAVTSPPW